MPNPDTAGTHEPGRRTRQRQPDPCPPAKALRALRRKHHRSQEEMARALNVHQTTYSRMETYVSEEAFENMIRGKHYGMSTPAGRNKAATSESLRRYEKIASVFGLEADDLLSTLGLLGVDDRDYEDIEYDESAFEVPTGYDPDQAQDSGWIRLVRPTPPVAIHSRTSLEYALDGDMLRAAPHITATLHLSPALYHDVAVHTLSLLASLWTDEFSESPSHLRAGTIIRIWTEARQLAHGNLYVVEHRRLLLVRRALYDGRGWWLSSDHWNRVAHPTVRSKDGDRRIRGAVTLFSDDLAGTRTVEEYETQHGNQPLHPEGQG